MEENQNYQEKGHCEYCGIEFIKSRIGHKYCSLSCGSLARYYRNHERKLKEARKRVAKNHKGYKAGLIKGFCKVCKKKFVKKTANQTYCSKECKKKYWDEVKNFKYFNKNPEKIEKAKKMQWLKLRFEIFKRDNFVCQYCGRNVKEDKIKLHIDHIIPKSKGGKDNPDNLITSCEECNEGKKDALLEVKSLK